MNEEESRQKRKEGIRREKVKRKKLAKMVKSNSKSVTSRWKVSKKEEA